MTVPKINIKISKHIKVHYHNSYDHDQISPPFCHQQRGNRSPKRDLFKKIIQKIKKRLFQKQH